jgi:hypothetical protein
MRLARVILLARVVLLATALCSMCVATVPLTLDQFRDCIGQNVGGWDTDCVLQSGTYNIDNYSVPYLSINRSSITVEGAWPYPTLLRIGSANSWLMRSDGATWVIIRHFVFDGNRNGGGFAANAPDLDLAECAYCQVYNATLQNSPNQALDMHSDVPSAIGLSTLTNAYRGGIYSDEGLCPYPGYWSPHVCQNVVENVITNNGGAGIGMGSSNVLINSNTFSGNNSICSDDAPAGQIGFYSSLSDQVTVEYNTSNSAPTCYYNGHYWWGAGIEYHGTNGTFTDNIIRYNSGEGMYLESAQYVTISTDNPSAYPISNNNQKGSGSTCGGFPGIRLHTSSSNSRLAQNITINNVWAVGGETWGVQFDACDTGQFTGPPIPNVTITNSCFAGNLNTGNNGIYDKHNCGSGHDQSCIGSGASFSNNSASGCGGY